MKMGGVYEERRGRARGRPRGRQRGRPRTHGRGTRGHKRNKIESDEEEEEKRPVVTEPIIPIQFSKDCDISSLEAPTFTTLDRGPPAPMLQLSWTHPVSLIGEKVLSPRIHSCDACNKPILIYGRMIPCKHVFCLSCAKGEDRVCARCGERVARVEQTGLGTVFMCTFAMNEALCKRTYLSQRDLQAHIDHRHMKISGAGSSKVEMKDDRMSHRDPRGEMRPSDARQQQQQQQQQLQQQQQQQLRIDPRPIVAAANDPRVGNKEGFDVRDGFPAAPFPRSFNPNQPPPPSPHHTVAPSSVSHHIPVMTSSRTNLITVPIQDPPEQPPSYQSAHPPPSYPPPLPHVQHPQHTPHNQPHNPLSHPLPPPPSHPSHPSHPFTSPPPIPHSQPLPYSTSVTSTYNSPYPNSQQPPQYTYTPTGAPPQSSLVPSPYASTLPPGPVPPPTTYGNQYTATQWSTPPPQPQSHQGPPPSHPISHPPPGPPRHHHPPNAQTGPYYR